MQDIRTLLNSYIASKNLVNPNVQAYINIDPLLSECINAEGRRKKKQSSVSEEQNLLSDYMKRDELLKKVVEKMQDWYEISREGEVSQKCGVSRVAVMCADESSQERLAETDFGGCQGEARKESLDADYGIRAIPDRRCGDYC